MRQPLFPKYSAKAFSCNFIWNSVVSESGWCQKSIHIQSMTLNQKDETLKQVPNKAWRFSSAEDVILDPGERISDSRAAEKSCEFDRLSCLLTSLQGLPWSLYEPQRCCHKQTASYFQITSAEKRVPGFSLAEHSPEKKRSLLSLLSSAVIAACTPLLVSWLFNWAFSLLIFFK